MAESDKNQEASFAVEIEKREGTLQQKQEKKTMRRARGTHGREGILQT